MPRELPEGVPVFRDVPPGMRITVSRRPEGRSCAQELANSFSRVGSRNFERVPTGASFLRYAGMPWYGCPSSMISSFASLGSSFDRPISENSSFSIIVLFAGAGFFITKQNTATPIQQHSSTPPTMSRMMRSRFPPPSSSVPGSGVGAPAREGAKVSPGVSVAPAGRSVAGAPVGATVGAAVGAAVSPGTSVGGAAVGTAVCPGASVGTVGGVSVVVVASGAVVGTAVSPGTNVGGAAVGTAVGTAVSPGTSVGMAVGSAVGTAVSPGTSVGCAVGGTAGEAVEIGGSAVGSAVGTAVSPGTSVGTAVGGGYVSPGVSVAGASVAGKGVGAAVGGAVGAGVGSAVGTAVSPGTRVGPNVGSAVGGASVTRVMVKEGTSGASVGDLVGLLVMSIG